MRLGQTLGVLFLGTVFLGLSVLLGQTTTSADDEWRQFRGPGGQGIAPEAANPPIEFDLGSGARWRTELHGVGWSSPVVADGRVWVTSAVATPASAEEAARRLAGDPMGNMKELAGELEVFAICVDYQTGKVIHEISLAKVDTPEPIHPLNSYASPTPFIEQNRVYCHFGNYGTWCLDTRSGETIWNTKYVVDYSVGTGSSPLVVEDKVILVCDGIDEQYVVAVNKLTGKEVWKTARPPMRATNGEYKKAYSTPITVDVNGKTQVVVPTAQWVCGYDPANGKEIWRADFGDGFSISPSPIEVDGLVVFSTGYMRPDIVAVRPDGKGDVTQSHIAWRISRGAPSKPSPIAYGNTVYLLSDSGVLTAVNSNDGKMLWQERIGGNFSASPTLVGNRLYLCSHEGIVHVFEVGDEYRRLAENELEPRILASPAVVGSDLLIRTEKALVRFGPSSSR